MRPGRTRWQQLDLRYSASPRHPIPPIGFVEPRRQRRTDEQIVTAAPRGHAPPQQLARSRQHLIRARRQLVPVDPNDVRPVVRVFLDPPTIDQPVERQAEIRCRLPIKEEGRNDHPSPPLRCTTSWDAITASSSRSTAAARTGRGRRSFALERSGHGCVTGRESHRAPRSRPPRHGGDWTCVAEHDRSSTGRSPSSTPGRPECLPHEESRGDGSVHPQSRLRRGRTPETSAPTARLIRRHRIADPRR